MSIAQPYLPSPFIHTAVKRRKNTWYTIASGNWSDPNIWMSNSHRRYSSPQTGDDVVVGFGHSVIWNISTTSAVSNINNLTVAGTLSMGSSGANRTFIVSGSLLATGTLDISFGGVLFSLYGSNNYVNTLIAGTNASAGTFSYDSGLSDQPILPLPYYNLRVSNGGFKYLSANVSIGNTFQQVNGTFDASAYDMTVNGTTTISNGTFNKTGSGSLLFVGLFTSANTGNVINLTGNPTVEFRGGFAVGSGGQTVNFGSGNMSFTTNTQTATLGVIIAQFNNNISVVGAIDLTMAGTGIFSLNQPIDHTVSGRTTTNKGTIYFNSTSSLPSFTTGTFDRTSFANTVGYTMGASITLPYTSYYSLLVSNSGTKTQVGNTTLLGNLSVSNTVTAAGTFDLGAFNITVNGTTSMNTGALVSTGAGSNLFIGAITLTGTPAFAQLDFRTGNPSVELRGGFNIGTSGSHTGSGQWKFSTNSQTIAVSNTGSIRSWDWSVLISGAITLTVSSSGTASTVMTTFNTINGDNAASKLLNAGTINFASTVTPMATGIFDDGASNSGTFLGYVMSSSYTLPKTSYNNLYIFNTGTKTIAGDTTISGTLTIGGGQTTKMELSSFNLTVSGATALQGTLSKSGAGNVLFVGQVLGSSAAGAIDFSTGNPTVEMRGGLDVAQGAFNTGTGLWTFTTNNQTITAISASGRVMNWNIFISGAITVTNTWASGTGTFVATSINGNNAASTFDNRGTVNYQATQQPMLTGILQTNLAANTFIYNAAGNQNIAGGTYRTLTLAGSGVKTLMGNVVVATLYTLTPPATLNLNGFTRT